MLHWQWGIFKQGPFLLHHHALAPLATWQTSPSLLHLHALAIQTEMEQRLEFDLSLNVKINVNVMRFSGFGDQVANTVVGLPSTFFGTEDIR